MKQPIKSTLVFIALALACWGLVTTAQATGSPTPTYAKADGDAQTVTDANSNADRG